MHRNGILRPLSLQELDFLYKNDKSFRKIDFLHYNDDELAAIAVKHLVSFSFVVLESELADSALTFLFHLQAKGQSMRVQSSNLEVSVRISS